MATRIYTKVSGAVGVTPSTWNFANQINPVTVPGTVVQNDGSTMTSKTETISTTNPHADAFGRTVIGPLAAQTISGTIKGQMRGSESNANANCTLALAVKIIQSDGSDRAVLLAQTASDSATTGHELTTTLTNMSFQDSAESASLSLTSQSAQAGDYLVIEWGIRSANTTAGRTVTLSYGNNSATDLAEDTTTTTANNPWWEFSATLAWLAPGAGTEAATPTFLVTQATTPIVRQATSLALRVDNTRRLRIPGPTHRQPTAAMLLQALDAAAPAAAFTPGALLVDATTYDISMVVEQAQQGTLLAFGGTPRYTEDFSGVSSVSIPGSTHGLGTADLLVQIYDTTGAVIDDPGIVTVRTDNFNVSATFRQNLSGTILLAAPTPRYGHDFSNTQSVNIAAATHGLGSGFLLWQCWDAGSPTRQLLTPGSLTIDASSFAVAMSFRQNQSGRLVLAAPASRAILSFTIASTFRDTLLPAGRQTGEATPVTSREQSGSGIVSAAAGRLASSLQTGAAITQGTSTRLASSLRAGTAIAQATTARIASSLRAGTGAAKATPSPIASENGAGTAIIQATTTRIASSLRAGTAFAQATLLPVASSLQAGSAIAQATPTFVASSLQAGSAQVQGLGAPTSDTNTNRAGTVQALAGELASSLRTGTALAQALAGKVASSLQSGNAIVQASTSPIASEIRASTGQTLASSSRIASSLRAATAQIQDAMLRTAHAAHTASATIQGHGIGELGTGNARTGSARMTAHPILLVQHLPAVATVMCVPGTTHGYGAAIWVETATLDNPAVLFQPGKLTIDQTRGDVQIWEAQGQGTLVIIHPVVNGYAQTFTEQLSLTIDSTTHTLETSDLCWQLVDAQTPAQVFDPGSFTIDQNDLTIEVTFRQAQSGTLRIGEGQPSYGQDFGPTQTVSIPGGTHTLGTYALRSHFYDAASPQAAIDPGTVTMATDTNTVTATFRQSQAGRIVLSAATPFLAPFPVGSIAPQAIHGIMSGHATLIATQPGTGATTVVVPGGSHGFGTPALFAQVYDEFGVSLVFEPGALTIDQTSADVMARFIDPPTGAMILRKAVAPYQQSFTGQTLLTIPAGTHGLGTGPLFLQVVDTATPAAVVRPASAIIDLTVGSPTLGTVTVRFDDAQSGILLLSAMAPMYSQAFSPATSWTILGSAHQLGTTLPVWQALDAAAPAALMEPGSVSVNTSNQNVTASFLDQQGGTLLLSAATPAMRVPFSLFGSASLNASGRTLGSGGPRVTSNFRTVTAKEVGIAGPIASGVLAPTGLVHGSSARVASSLQAARGTVADTTQRLGNAIRLSTARIQSQAALVASSLRTGAGTARGLSGQRASSLVTVQAQVLAQTQRITNALQMGLARVQTTAARVASSLRGGAATSRSNAAQKASSLRAGAAKVQTAPLPIASAIRTDAAKVQGLSTQLASSLRAGTARVQAQESHLAPGAVARIALVSATALVRIVTNSCTGSATVGSSPVSMNHTLFTRTGSMATTLLAVNATYQDVAASLQGSMVPIASSVQDASAVITAAFSSSTAATHAAQAQIQASGLSRVLMNLAPPMTVHVQGVGLAAVGRTTSGTGQWQSAIQLANTLIALHAGRIQTQVIISTQVVPVPAQGGVQGTALVLGGELVQAGSAAGVYQMNRLIHATYRWPRR